MFYHRLALVKPKETRNQMNSLFLFLNFPFCRFLEHCGYLDSPPPPPFASRKNCLCNVCMIIWFVVSFFFMTKKWLHKVFFSRVIPTLLFRGWAGIRGGRELSSPEVCTCFGPLKKVAQNVGNILAHPPTKWRYKFVCCQRFINYSAVR